MKPSLYPAAVLLAGLIAAQILFSGLVFLSDLSLHETLVALQQSGYVTVPNAQVMPTLRQVTPAICGGLFFTLTTGAGLSLVTFLIMCAWRRFSNRYWLLAGLFLAAAVFFAVKFQYQVPVTLACILIITTVMGASLLFSPDANKQGYPLWFVLVAHLAAVILIALIWLPVANADAFVAIRDNLLLTNPIGRKINNFYYQYTLYPAETFKSLDQKLLKTSRIQIDDEALHQSVKQQMVARDYLPVAENFNPDLTVTNETHTLIFRHQAKTVHRCSVSEFQTGPEQVLEEISEKTDHNKFLRKLTFLSLIIASPLICYIFLHTVFMGGLAFIKPQKPRFIAASAACLILFSLPAMALHQKPPDTFEASDIDEFMESDRWQDRVAALKAISEQDLRIDRFAVPAMMIESPVIAERYWLARALGGSRSSKSYQQILRLLEDPQPNVVCMAMYSLGKQHRSGVIAEILHRMKTTDHWYVQWYAYKALKRLGWTQKK